MLPKGCDFLAYFIVGVDPPDPSERVNVYLPKSLIGQIDRRAAELGMKSLELFRARCQHGADLFPCPHCGTAGVGGAPLEGTQDR